MDIKIEDYLDEQEIKEICKDALYQKIREDMRKLNVNDIIANISYAEVEAMVDTYVGEDNFCKKEIPQKVHRVIDELSTYTVFRKADDRTNYETRKQVEDTCRAMIASYMSDSMTYAQYKNSENEEKLSWAEQAKIRANKTAVSYNEYILKNAFVWEDNIPNDIYKSLSYLE